jgi:hypothetical protein
MITGLSHIRNVLQRGIDALQSGFAPFVVGTHAVIGIRRHMGLIV